MAFTDRYGLTVTTDSSVAFERFQEGMDHLLAYGPEGETRLVTWDSGHLTTDGAMLVGRRIVADDLSR